jgi:beta-xylosidase
MLSLILAAALFLTAFANPANYSNPIIYSDFADNDVSKGPDGAYYFSASSFQFSPGAPILKSWDLVNWELIGHSIPMLDFGAGYNMSGTPSWVLGVWASTLRYRESNKTWYWIGCIGFWNTYIYTAPNITGPWTKSAALPGGTCYYDCGLLIDDDDSMYVAYGNTNVSIAQLSSDGLSQVKTQQVFSGPPGMEGIEGNRLYKINGTYYVLDDWPSGATFIWKASSVWGPWTYKILQQSIGSPLPGGGLIDQGSLVQAPDGSWVFMSCSWDYPSGRIPVMAPITWDSDGWPTLVRDSNGNWASSYAFPGNVSKPTPPFTGIDTFAGNSLKPAWEWNFNPDTTKFTVDNGLTLHTATVTNDLYASRNVLTHRVHGPNPVGTVYIDVSNMADGDKAGLAAFRDQSSWIQVQRSGSTFNVAMVYNSTQDPNNSWQTISTGTVIANATLTTKKVWLRTNMNAMPSSNKQAAFSYSTDGKSFKTLGQPFVMNTGYQYFTGYRYGIFNFATKALGGSIKVLSFDSE